MQWKGAVNCQPIPCTQLDDGWSARSVHCIFPGWPLATAKGHKTHLQLGKNGRLIHNSMACHSHHQPEKLCSLDGPMQFTSVHVLSSTAYSLRSNQAHNIKSIFKNAGPRYSTSTILQLGTSLFALKWVHLSGPGKEGLHRVHRPPELLSSPSDVSIAPNWLVAGFIFSKFSGWKLQKYLSCHRLDKTSQEIATAKNGGGMLSCWQLFFTDLDSIRPEVASGSNTDFQHLKSNPFV